jgi:hypothetical protein
MLFISSVYRTLQKDGSLLDVSGYRCGESGLAYHEQRVHEGLCHSCRSERYIVDHLASGYMIPPAWFYTPNQAESFIARIAQLADWKQDRQALRMQPHLPSLIEDTYWNMLRHYSGYDREYVSKWGFILLGTLDEEGNDVLPESQRPCPLWREEIFMYFVAAFARRPPR